MNRESEIIKRIRRGDKGQFESLFRSSYTSLVHYAKKLIKDSDTAEEIVQDLFVRLWQDKEKIRIQTPSNKIMVFDKHKNKPTISIAATNFSN